MWPTLRAHAEWVLAHVLQMGEGRLVVEARPPGRLAGEPSVFGGSTGAEVFVELVRRIVSPGGRDRAARRASGRASATDVASRSSPSARSAPTRSSGCARRRAPRFARCSTAAPDGDLATVIFALTQLGVLEVLASIGDLGRRARTGPPRATPRSTRRRSASACAREPSSSTTATTSRCSGSPRDATGYEVRRAFLELRRAFDPSRMLTPDVADLAPDVRKITVVLEEAYEILKDTARRDRYRRAIEAVPDGA